MTTDEFIKKVESLGYEVGTHSFIKGERFHIQNTKGIIIAVVEFQRQYGLSISFDENEENQGELFDLLTEYAKTPIEEREEKKKYHLQLSGAGISEFNCYLNRLYNTTFFFADDEEGYGVKTKFTDEEISELPDWVSDMLRDGYLIKEEAKDDNKN